MQQTNKLLVAVSQHTVFLAELSIAGCRACSPSASVPLVHILDSLGKHPPGTADYILPVLASCPQCHSALDERTLVLPGPGKRPKA